MEEAKPRNGKRSRVAHTLNQLAKLPKPFTANSVAEERALQYLGGVHAAWAERCRHRRPLFTHPKNECDVAKFVCTTVRTSCPCLSLTCTHVSFICKW